MRILLWILTGLGMAAGTSPAVAAEGDSHSGQAFSPWATIDASAQEIFSQADKNHNDFLSKIEFGRARAALTGEIEAWGQLGLIGKPIKSKAKSRSSQPPPVPIDVKVAGDNLARSNKVSLAEFMHFAHAALTDADSSWRQMHAARAAQRKAESQQRKALDAERRAGRLRGRTVFGIPF